MTLKIIENNIQSWILWQILLVMQMSNISYCATCNYIDFSVCRIQSVLLLWLKPADHLRPCRRPGSGQPLRRAPGLTCSYRSSCWTRSGPGWQHYFLRLVPVWESKRASRKFLRLSNNAWDNVQIEFEGCRRDGPKVGRTDQRWEWPKDWDRRCVMQQTSR